MKNVLRYKTMAELTKQFSEAEILKIVSDYLDRKAVQAEYHKKYNTRRNEALRKLREEHPEQYAELMES